MEIIALNVDELIDFLRSHKSSVESSLVFEQSVSTL